MLGSTLIFTRFSFDARCAATLTAVSARDSGMVFAQPPQRNSQQTFLSLGAEMKSYSFLHSLYKFFDLIISPKHFAVNLFCNLTLNCVRFVDLTFISPRLKRNDSINRNSFSLLEIILIHYLDIRKTTMQTRRRIFLISFIPFRRASRFAFFPTPLTELQKKLS